MGREIRSWKDIIKNQPKEHGKSLIKVLEKGEGRMEPGLGHAQGSSAKGNIRAAKANPKIQLWSTQQQQHSGSSSSS